MRQEPAGEMMIKTTFSDDELKQVERLLQSININLASLKTSHVLRRLRVRMSRTNCKTVGEYSRYLNTHEEEKKKLYLAFSINVTRFFRNPDTFQFLKEKVFPLLVRRTDRHKPLKIWSAGCADGAEAYTLAILCKQFNLRPGRVIIYATDYNRELLAAAKERIFPFEYLRETPEEIQNAYFTQVSRNDVQISPELKHFIEFQEHNLLQENVRPPAPSFDMIVCRNVLIYFTMDQHEGIFQQFYRYLKPQGFLVIGRTEILPIKWHDRFTIFSSHHRISRKKEQKTF
ncbi:MAG: CheR family methyltransferase [Candidatus Hodarchaeota archaeon]